MLIGNGGKDGFRIGPATIVDSAHSLVVETVIGSAQRGRDPVASTWVWAGGETLSACKLSTKHYSQQSEVESYCQSHMVPPFVCTLEAACRERNTRTSKSRPSVFISSCNRLMVALFNPSGWFTSSTSK
jgi:hypothetical protein